MTTSTTDAEAIARIVSPDSWKIRDRHVAGANSDPGLTETERANALASAECYVQESLRRATAILSYLASRRETQEPVAHPKIMYVCECCYEHTPEVCGYDRRDIYVTPDGKWLCDGCIDAEDIPSRDCVSPPLLYTAPPPPAGAPTIITYTNYRGETAQRTILPKSIWFGSTEWHPEPQWLLRATDVAKNAERDFALKDFGTAQAGAVARLRKALNEIDALDPEEHSSGCSAAALRGLVMRMGEIARAALNGGKNQ